jgi:hypothetical protein
MPVRTGLRYRSGVAAHPCASVTPFSAFALGLVLAACAATPGSETQKTTPSVAAHAPASEAPSPAPATDASAPAPAPAFVPPPREAWPERYLGFDAACAEGPTVTIAAVGDVLLHHELQIQAFADPQRYRALWSGVEDLLGRADITYANLEGPTAHGITRNRKLVKDPGLRFDNKVYTGYARFNYNPALVEDLVTAGVDIVSTSNNHSLDRGPIGIDRTIDALEQSKLRFTGTRRQGDTKAPWHAITEANGIRVAWLACTLHTNFEKDDAGQVLHCFDDETLMPRLVRELADDPQVDAVIVTPHWGKEYSPTARDDQTKLARRLFEAGATAIIGSHPHVLQPWERVQLEDGREGFIVYSLGNFASHQRDLPRRSSIILYLSLRRVADGKVRLAGAGYVPIHVRMEGEKESFFVEAIDRVSGPPEARELVTAMYGEANLLAPDAALDLAPHCRPAWGKTG